MDIYFDITNNTTIDEVDSFLWRTFGVNNNIITNKKVILNINLREYTDSYFHLLKFKGVLDKYREYSREYILYTNVIIDNELITTILKILLIFFEPENPVYIINK
jgi:hypothetical protein